MKRIFRLGILFIGLVVTIGLVNKQDSTLYTTTTSALSLKSPGVGVEVIPIISSDKYKIDHDKFYIYTKTDVDSNVIKSNINVKNGSISIEDDVLYVTNIIDLRSGKGDVNLDGQVSFEDAFHLVSHLGNPTLTGESLQNADVNGDGKVNEDDANLIFTYITGETGSEVSSLGGKGDVNQDGVIDAKDAVLVLRSLSELETLSDEQKELADVVEDGEVRATDARKILQYISYYCDEVTFEYDIVNISSSVYDLSGKEIIISEDFDENNIVITNGDLAVSDGKLLIKYGGEVLDTYSITLKPEETTTEKKEDNPSTSDMTMGNIIFIGGCMLLIAVYSLKKFRKIKR